MSFTYLTHYRPDNISGGHCAMPKFRSTDIIKAQAFSFYVLPKLFLENKVETLYEKKILGRK